jgi:mono/diheme cytochrome c family protein
MNARLHAVVGGVLACTVVAAAAPVQRAFAQDGRSVEDGVYTDAQATRGAMSYAASCAGCHRIDLGGADGPPLRDERFTRNFAGKNLDALYTKITTSMPRGAAGSLADAVYLDILAHLLRENGFPAGKKELTAEEVNQIAVLPGHPKPLPPVGDFSFVEVVGCLGQNARDQWLLTNGSEPAAVAADAALDKAHRESIALGSHTYHLLDAIAYAPAAHSRHKMYVRGLLVRLAGEERLTISAMEMVSRTCE